MTDVVLPSLGESVTEGIVLRWIKKVGDHVERDEPIVEISTDKVDSEMPSPASGTLTQILAHEGDTVEVGARLAVIGESGSAPVVTGSPQVGTAIPDVSPTAEPTPAPPPRFTPVSTGGSVAGVVASPVVRRILTDGGVDAAAVQGSGPGGVITRRDAERAVSNGPTDDVVVPLSNGRRRMAEHMTSSAQSTPHGFVAVEVDASVFARVESVGRRTRDGATIPDEALVALAAVRALAEFPTLNATFADGDLVEHRTINLGLARHADRDGMLVPVVHAAAGLTLRAMARRLDDLAERVETRQLTTDDLMGGTFTLMSAPTEHTLLVEPIIIQPQVAILSVGAVRSTPVVVIEGGREAVAVGQRVVLGLSFDHRVSDPTAAARYLERVGELLGAIDIEAER